MHIQIVPLQFDEPSVVEDIRLTIKNVLGIDSSVTTTDLSLKDAWDPIRKQMNSSWILAQLHYSIPNGNSKILGVTNFDLYIPVLTYVIGEAELDGRVAIISSFRLKEEHYGLPENSKKLRERMGKEALHELGHTFGLRHCFDVSCIMRPSSFVEEIDEKESQYCPECLTELDV